MTEAQLRTLAKKLGLRFAKSNWRKDSIDNIGGYRLEDIVSKYRRGW